MLRLLLATLVALALTGCARSTPSLPKSEPVVLPELPANLTTCARLDAISDRAGEVEDVSFEELRVFWAQDRVVAAQCRRRLLALVEHYRQLRTGLMTAGTD
jgi:hypothetical protein